MRLILTILFGSMVMMNISRASEDNLDFESLHFVHGKFEKYATNIDDAKEKLPDSIKSVRESSFRNNNRHGIFKIVHSEKGDEALLNKHFVFSHHKKLDSISYIGRADFTHIKVSPEFQSGEEVRVWIRREGDYLVATTLLNDIFQITPLPFFFPFRDKPLNADLTDISPDFKKWPVIVSATTANYLFRKTIKESELENLSEPQAWQIYMVLRYGRQNNEPTLMKFIASHSLTFFELMHYDSALIALNTDDWKRSDQRFIMYTNSAPNWTSKFQAELLIAHLSIVRNYLLSQHVFELFLLDTKRRKTDFGIYLTDNLAYLRSHTGNDAISLKSFKEFLIILQKSEIENITKQATKSLSELNKK